MPRTPAAGVELACRPWIRWACYDRYYGDPAVGPNPNLAPIEKPPFYGLEVIPGVIGAKGGPETDERTRVLNVWGQVTPGPCAGGNIAAFWLGPGYPGQSASLGPGMTFGVIPTIDAARTKPNRRRGHPKAQPDN
jgi:3-oxosteroid 1-dehydrogenase